MSRLIDADELANKVADLYTEGEEATEADKVVNDVIDLIDDAPTVLHDNYSMGYQDGVKKVLSERPTGHWFLLDECSNEGVYCSNCRKKVYRVEYANQKVKSNYCPNCGADMRGDRE